MDGYHFIRSGRFAIGLVLFAGCGGQVAPTSGVMTGAASASHGKSWMLPEAKRRDLLYVSDDALSDVDVYSLGTLKLMGNLTGLNKPQGECVDATGDVWVTDIGTAQIIEYAHGGTSPINMLADPSGYPVACAVDPSTGNLAVMSIVGLSGPGAVLVYLDASGTPTTYADPALYYYYSGGYDDRGDLFIDGTNADGVFGFAELSNGNNSLTNITLKKSISVPGDVQWDGKRITLESAGLKNTLIYRLRIWGSTGAIVGATRLKPPCSAVSQTWIERDVVIAAFPHSCDATIDVWRYPAGGPANEKRARPRRPDRRNDQRALEVAPAIS
ncbi:MAG: hypothetical protein WA304_09270 [Candidatus Cybelea sp.]